MVPKMFKPLNSHCILDLSTAETSLQKAILWPPKGDSYREISIVISLIVTVLLFFKLDSICLSFLSDTYTT